jgi:serine/threonine protein kinase
LGHLKKLSHIHIVELIGSYTDPKFVGIIMSPVAEYNLKDFLELDPLPSGARSFLRTFFGCLAAALCYLHDNRVRHKDIKPQNILVKGHQIFLTDLAYP